MFGGKVSDSGGPSGGDAEAVAFEHRSQGLPDGDGREEGPFAPTRKSAERDGKFVSEGIDEGGGIGEDPEVVMREAAREIIEGGEFSFGEIAGSTGKGLEGEDFNERLALAELGE